jgi:putative DNA primase/helicase
MADAREYVPYYEVLPDGASQRRWRLSEAPVKTASPAVDGLECTAADSRVETFFPQGFAAKRVAERLREDTAFASGGGRLFVYLNGAYRANGESHVQTRTAQLLGDRWTRKRADEVVGYLLATSPALWDRPPLDIVNVRNGLLDVASGRLQEHTPDFLSPIQIGAAFDPKGACASIDHFVREVFPPDAYELAYELPGHLMIPDTRPERGILLLGGGANGKSTYLAVIENFLGGSANVSAIPLQALDSNRFAAAGLYGKLANIVADLDADAVRSSAMFKAIVSGDVITAERKYGTPFSFRPYARLLFSANEPPPTHDTSYAYFRRWLIVPFEATFTGSRRDPDLRMKLTTPQQLSGLLNRALEGLYRLRKQDDFTKSETLDIAAREFRTAVDSAAAFVAGECLIGPGLRIARPRLYEQYKAWCANVTRSPLSARRFNERVRSLLPDPGAAVVTIQGTEYWQGVTLRSEAPDNFPDSVTAYAGEPEPPPTAPLNESEGGGRVEKVAVLSTLTPPVGEERKGVRSSSTFSTLSTHHAAAEGTASNVPQPRSEEPAWTEEVP